jgi:hypothetical protein
MYGFVRASVRWCFCANKRKLARTGGVGYAAIAA